MWGTLVCPSSLCLKSNWGNQSERSPVSDSCRRYGRRTIHGYRAVSELASAIVANSASASILPSLGQLHEPANALSLPTWAIHVSSVVEWITAIGLVWQYGEKTGRATWKGLSWGMLPLLGGALCACTWHFFYNSESLEVVVAYQAALTVIGNATMCIAAYRIYKSTS